MSNLLQDNQLSVMLKQTKTKANLSWTRRKLIIRNKIISDSKAKTNQKQVIQNGENTESKKFQKVKKSL